MTGMEMSVADILGLRSQKVENWCTTETMVGPLFLSPSASLQEIIDNFYRLEVSALVVKEGSKLVGIVSEHDVICSLKLHGGFSDVITAESIMSGKLVTIRRDQTCAEAVSIMTEARIRHLPVLDGYGFFGLLTIIDAALGQMCQASGVTHSILSSLSKRGSPIPILKHSDTLSDVLRTKNWDAGILVDTGAELCSFVSGAELSRLVIRIKSDRNILSGH